MALLVTVETVEYSGEILSDDALQQQFLPRRAFGSHDQQSTAVRWCLHSEGSDAPTPSALTSAPDLDRNRPACPTCGVGHLLQGQESPPTLQSKLLRSLRCSRHTPARATYSSASSLTCLIQKPYLNRT